MIKRKIWSVAAIGISFLVFALFGFDVWKPHNWALPIFAGLVLYFAGLWIMRVINKNRGDQ